MNTLILSCVSCTKIYLIISLIPPLRMLLLLVLIHSLKVQLKDRQMWMQNRKSNKWVKIKDKWRDTTERGNIISKTRVHIESAMLRVNELFVFDYIQLRVKCIEFRGTVPRNERNKRSGDAFLEWNKTDSEDEPKRRITEGETQNKWNRKEPEVSEVQSFRTKGKCCFTRQVMSVMRSSAGVHTKDTSITFGKMRSVLSLQKKGILDKQEIQELRSLSGNCFINIRIEAQASCRHPENSENEGW